MTDRPRWLTPDIRPADDLCRVLLIPNDVEWLAIVAGALNDLIYPYNFEDFGTSTPEETAGIFADMFDRFTFNQGVCRVIGEIIAYAGAASPDANWLSCDGASLVRADYPDLFAVIGTTYGAVDGSHFNVPDLRGRSAVAQGSGPGLATRALGDAYGEQDHTLIVAETPSHSHVDTGHTHVESVAVPSVGAAITGIPVPSAVPGAGITGSGSAALSSTGGDGAHNNLGPRLAINYLIVAAQ